MKTIVRKDNNVSLYLFEDDKITQVSNTQTIVGFPPEFVIGDCTIENSIVYNNLSAPEEWKAWKYLYTPESGWLLNPNWIPPEPITV